MKIICACFVLLLLSASARCQTGVDDYIVQDSSEAILMSTKQCRKLIYRQTRRIEAQTTRLAKVNNKYLHAFMKCEDALLHSLCSFNPAAVEQTKPQRPVAPNKLQSMNLASAANDVDNIHAPLPADRLKDQHGALPETKADFFINMEARAEAMMMDAWYSFNRFENKSGREKSERPQRYDAAVDTLNVSMQYLSEKCQSCNDAGRADFVSANTRLKQEMKRSELIQSYINERREFLSSNMKGVPGAEAMLLPLKINEVYFSRHIGECKKLFLDRSKWEQKLLSKIGGAKDFASFMDQHGDLAMVQQSAQNSRPSLSLQELIDEKIQSGEVSADKSKLLQDILPQGTMAKAKEAKELDKNVKNTLALSDSLSALKADSTSIAEKKEAPWQPDPLKTKRFIDRFSIISNLQFDNRSTFLPASATGAAGIQFMYHRNGNLGAALSCIQPMPRLRPGSEDSFRIPTATGLGLRTYADFRLKSALFAQAGYEINWRPYEVGSATGRWERMPSAMAGLKIKYPVGKTRTAPTIEFLYDFLHAQTGQPAFVFRTGVNIRGKHGIH
jgi:hypothetical protein